MNVINRMLGIRNCMITVRYLFKSDAHLLLVRIENKRLVNNLTLSILSL